MKILIFVIGLILQVTPGWCREIKGFSNISVGNRFTASSLNKKMGRKSDQVYYYDCPGNGGYTCQDHTWFENDFTYSIDFRIVRFGCGTPRPDVGNWKKCGIKRMVVIRKSKIRR